MMGDSSTEAQTLRLDSVSTTEYVGDPYLIARELCGAQDYFLSYASAMELHRMVTQPQLTLYVSSTVRKPSRTIHGYEYHFVALKPEQFLEPVYDLLSSSLRKARWIICRLVFSLRSQFFQSRRHFSSHAKDRSTIHRLGSTANVCSWLRLTI